MFNDRDNQRVRLVVSASGETVLGPSSGSGAGLDISGAYLVGDQLRALPQTYAIPTASDQDLGNGRRRRRPGGQPVRLFGASGCTRDPRPMRAGSSIRSTSRKRFKDRDGPVGGPEGYRFVGRRPRQLAVTARQCAMALEEAFDPLHHSFGINLDPSGGPMPT